MRASPRMQLVGVPKKGAAPFINTSWWLSFTTVEMDRINTFIKDIYIYIYVFIYVIWIEKDVYIYMHNLHSWWIFQHANVSSGMVILQFC